MSDTKTTRTRTAPTDFGRKLKGFVGSVDPKKLQIQVAHILGKDDPAEVGDSIASFVRNAGKNNGVVSIRSQPLADAVLTAVVALDSDQQPVSESLHKSFHFTPISSANRDSASNWLVRLKAGEAVETDGPDGHGTYKLVKVED